MTRSNFVHLGCDDADEGRFPVTRGGDWRTVYTTMPSRDHVSNPGTGLVGYLWEENGPALAARHGQRGLRSTVEDMVALPYADILYIRCDWRDVQSAAGRLDLTEVWQLAEEFASREGRRIAFRVQCSNPDRADGKLAVPEFLLDKVPVKKIGSLVRRGEMKDMYEPAYDDDAFRAAFIELTDLLAERFDGHDRVEFVDLMMYGFWGEGHTADLRHPFESDSIAEQTFVDLTTVQVERWHHTPLVVNLQPDISSVGNARVQEIARQAGGWVRTDSVIIEEPQQIADIYNRPASAAAILEDGAYRTYDLAPQGHDGVERATVHPMVDTIWHALDAGPNYWSLWTEARNVAQFFERFPETYGHLVSRLGYRVRPAWVWQRRVTTGDEVIIGVANSGVAGIPGRLHIALFDEEHRQIQCTVLPAGAPLQGAISLVRYPFPSRLLGTRVGLSAAIEIAPNVIKPVTWCATDQPAADGCLWFNLATHDQIGWRGGL